MAKTVETYKILPRFIGSIVHTYDQSGNAVSILLDVNTLQSDLEFLFNKGYEGVTK